MALVAEYRRCCAERRVKPNKLLISALPADRTGLTALDLSGNVIGGRGLDPLVDVLRGAPNLASLCLRGNNLTAPSVQRMAAALRGAHALRTVDLSANDIRLAGPDLLELVRTNRGIRDLVLTETHLRPLFANLILMQLRKNSGLPPPAAPAAAAAAAAEEERRRSTGCLKQQANTSKTKQVDFDDDVGFAPQDPGGTDAVSHEQLRRFSAFDDAESDGAGDGDFGSFGAAMPDSSDAAAKSGAGGARGMGAPVTSFRAGPAEVIGGDPSSHAAAMQLKKVANRRPTVCAEVFTEEQLDRFVPDVHDKTAAERDFLLMALERNNLFNHLDDRELMVAADAMSECLRCAGDYVYEQGDDELDTFYIVYSGEVSLWVDEEQTKTLRKAMSFGELFLLYPQDALESAKTERESTLFMLDRMTYKFILSQASKKKRALYGGFLKKVPFLQSLSSAELLQLADALKGSVYDGGAHLIRYGEDGNWLHIVVEGTVEVIGRDSGGGKIKVCEFTVGDCVGELEFINNHQTVADVLARGKVRTAKMNRRHFEMCMGPVIDLLRKNADKLEVYAYYRETLARIKG